MNAISREEEEILSRLEARLESVTGVIARLKERNAELELRAKEAIEDREVLEKALKESQDEASQLREESETLRVRQREAASRIRNLLAQVEQMDLLGENG